MLYKLVNKVPSKEFIYKKYILNRCNNLFKIIIEYCILIIWWSVVAVVATTLTINELTKIMKFCDKLSEKIFQIILKAVSYVLEYIYRVYPTHSSIKCIYDRNSKKPYIFRHYLLLKERDTFPFNIFIHKFMRGDEDDIHDHPWDFFHIILSEGYWEYVPKNIDRSTLDQGVEKIWRKPGYFGKCSTNYKHRIVLENNKKPWTIFIPFKRITEWGFWVPIIWQTTGNCKVGTTINDDHLDCTKWQKIMHEKYMKDKYG